MKIQIRRTNFIENQTEITDLYSELSYDELKSVLEGWLNPTNESGDESVSQETLSTSTQPKQLKLNQQRTN